MGFGGSVEWVNVSVTSLLDATANEDQDRVVPFRRFRL